MNVMSYTVHHLIDNIIFITDEKQCCIYLVKGTEHALLIDSGMDLDRLKPLIDTLVDTPYYVACTHGHIDHVGRSGEFDHLYMDKKDINVYKDNRTIGQYNEYYSTIGLSFIDEDKILDMPEYFDLGDRKIYVVKCPGHTPGSVMFVDSVNHTVFTGDAIGSGCSIWMQVDYATSIKTYKESLLQAYYNLLLMGAAYNWYFLGGHDRQEYMSKVSEYNLLNIHMITDMMTLCDKLLDHTIDFRPINTMTFSTGQPYYASHGKAEMIFTMSQLED